MNRATPVHLLLLICSIVPRARGADELIALEAQLAAEPAIIRTREGRTVHGLLDGWREGRVHLRLATDGGEVGFSFAPAEIARLDLPGAEAEARTLDSWERGEAGAALPGAEALTRQRLRYLPVLTAEQRRPLIVCVAAHAQAGSPLAALGYAEHLLPVARGEAERRALLDARLIATLRTGNGPAAEKLALAWCGEYQDPSPSALGWSVLARLAFEAGEFERCRWIALQPVVFAGEPAPDHLQECYTLAMQAAQRLGDDHHAAVLAEEARCRGLPSIRGAGSDGAREQPAVSGRVPPLRAAAQETGPDPQAARDGGLQVETVCKLLPPPHPAKTLLP